MLSYSMNDNRMTLELFFRQLHTEMTERPFLKQNPVFVRFKEGTLTPQMLAESIRQYVCFTEEIVKMLKGAAQHLPKTNPIHQELERNWEQESGSATGGIPHVDLLKHGLKRDLSIDADHVHASRATKRFLSTVHEGMKENTWFALGQAYALEASAVPELAILVGPALNAYASLIQKSPLIHKIALTEKGTHVLPKIATSEQAFAMSMSDWFALHIADFEVSHRDYLRERVQAYLQTDDEQDEFAKGFRHVLNAMDDWWEGLSL